MKVQTKFQGEIDVLETDLFTFVKPLLGFEEQTTYALVPALEEVSPFAMLQAVEDVDVAFYLVSPWVVDEDYEFDLTDEQVKSLGIEQSEDVQVMTLVTVNSDIEKMTTNLVAPIVMNKKTQRAKQIVLEQTPYTTRHFILKKEAE